jgi:hypothetical protein
VSAWTDRVDPLAWVHTDDPIGLPFEQLDSDGIAYLMCETLDGRPISWAPLGSGKPYPSGEGVAWQIRTVIQ